MGYDGILWDTMGYDGILWDIMGYYGMGGEGDPPEQSAAVAA